MKDTPTVGILTLNFGLFLWVVHDAISKWLIETYPAFEIMFLRSLVALPLILIIVRWEQGHLDLRTNRFWTLVGRGLLSVGSFTTFLYGLKLMLLADAFAIFMSGPLFVAALAGVALKEPATRRQWIAVLVGFAAVLVMVRPGGSISLLGALVMLGATLFFALSVITTRLLGRTESAGVISVFVMAIFVLAGALAMPFMWVTPSLFDFGVMAIIGVLSAGAMYSTIYSFRIAPPALLAPFQYTAIVWALLIGYLWWGDTPAASVLAAAVVVVASGLYVLRGEPSRQSG